jgi:hypothetical protein
MPHRRRFLPSTRYRRLAGINSLPSARRHKTTGTRTRTVVTTDVEDEDKDEMRTDDDDDDGGEDDE